MASEDLNSLFNDTWRWLMVSYLLFPSLQFTLFLNKNPNSTFLHPVDNLFVLLANPTSQQQHILLNQKDHGPDGPLKQAISLTHLFENYRQALHGNSVFSSYSSHLIIP
jgi:hypothetical protein